MHVRSGWESHMHLGEPQLKYFEMLAFQVLFTR
jgi:hypothetical protein